LDLIAELRKHGHVPVEIPGWDRYSVWGWNAREGSLFAEMWPNVGDPDGRPMVALGAPYTGTVTRVEDLALEVSERLGITYGAACLALAEFAPPAVAAVLRASPGTPGS
jgi:hypothetical protein